MTKLVGPVSHELGVAKDKVEALEKDKRGLEERVLRLEMELKRHKIPVPTNKKPKPVARHSFGEKNFLKATKASHNRSVQSKSQPQPQEDLETPTTSGMLDYDQYTSSRYRYKDGILIRIDRTVVDREWTSGFQRPTIASENKRRTCESDNWSWNEDDEEEETIQGSDEYLKLKNTEEDDYGSTQLEPLEEPEREKSAEEISKEEALEAAEKLLSERSGLDRETGCHVSFVHLKSRVIFDHLQQALRLAQQIFFDGVRKHFPWANFRYQGYHEVQFGREDIERSFLSRMEPKGVVIDGCRWRLADFRYPLQDIIQLRNQVCHFHGYYATDTLWHYDRTMKEVQRLAVIFGDEQNAFRVRTLRDRLIRHAEDMVGNVESLALLAELPHAKPWENLDVQLFNDVARKDYEEISPLVRLAAGTWDVLQSKPGKGDWKPESFVDSE
ncbi:hypothetical protein M426DRAFT_13182 [Hypoxylon sp. CI-4A]|nr:hypothetical protein M426DRAFT_13182 [Hypoxylon sp. CI-4A]